MLYVNVDRKFFKSNFNRFNVVPGEFGSSHHITTSLFAIFILTHFLFLFTLLCYFFPQIQGSPNFSIRRATLCHIFVGLPKISFI